MPSPTHTHLDLYAEDTALLSQSWRPDTISRRLSQAVATLLKYFSKRKFRLNVHKTETILFSKRRPPLPETVQICNTFALDLGRKIIRPSSRPKSVLLQAPTYRHQQSHRYPL